jgi:WXXGXW repeat (2 copies)
MHIRFLRGLLPALVLAALPAISSAALFVGVSVNIAPPALPIYVQPPCPQPGYLWTPGYWAWNDGAYYWVPGTWVEPPEVGFLWTPGYWGWGDGAYFWHAGYWGPHVGFYGGVNYGFGYNGVGFEGGYWHGRVFMYNRAVVHVGPAFANVYSRPVAYRGAYAHVSFNGGPGGVIAHASRAQMMAAHEHHVAFTPVQRRQQHMAFADRSLRADYNHGRPPIAATARPAVFHGSGAFAARAAGGHYTPAHAAPAMRSDRPPGATGQNRSGYERTRPQHFQEQRPVTQQHFRSQQHVQPQQHFQPQRHVQQQQHFQPQRHVQAQQRFQPQQRFQQRPEARPSVRQGARAAPHPQQRGGERHPPENRGHDR